MENFQRKNAGKKRGGGFLVQGLKLTKKKKPGWGEKRDELGEMAHRSKVAEKRLTQAAPIGRGKEVRGGTLRSGGKKNPLGRRRNSWKRRLKRDGEKCTRLRAQNVQIRGENP